MKKPLGLVLLGAAIFTLAKAAPLESWRPLQARYTIFSGLILSDREAPTPTERKLSILIEGKPAKEIFDSIGPDLRYTCSQDEGDRQRAKQGVQCTYTAEGRNKGYDCWIGIDLRTGKSIGTVSC
ncbi:hypothetical protein OU994_08960 [Pseudoduganella sp. SL102]|uniref:hypothetical protein n=1 Tax=Pseudoduganella sp. SL102 TaxID=2995154 RepID=UPI00248C65A3|nr:hypothetical protein [Pseudoduganella sp. SL102]WBS04392.1 hypothetical protein OU994_08960 [Pseudoduganella sp. SL102]